MADHHFETACIHAGEPVDPSEQSLRLPLHMSSSFQLPDFGPELFDTLMLGSDRPRFHQYTRWTNPTLRALEDRLAVLEEAEAGLVFASGMAAITSLTLTLLQAGDHLIVSDVCYIGSSEFYGLYLKNYGIEVSRVDTSSLAEIEAAIRPNTRMIAIETPVNPILRLADVQAIAEISHAAGALLVVDSTFGGPLLQKPLALGADYVIHSVGKYLNGHGDLLAGVVLGPKDGLHRIRQVGLIHLGGALSPFNAWLAMRGLTTYPLRMQRHCENAMAVAQYLEGHPAIARVIYPGLDSHPQHALAQRQMRSGFGGMVNVHLKGGIAAAVSFKERARLWRYATSLGHPDCLAYYLPTELFLGSPPPLDSSQQAGVRTLRARRVHVHAKDARGGEELRDPPFHLFGTDAGVGELRLFAGPAPVRDTLLVHAVVTDEAGARPVEGERDVARRAAPHQPAARALEERRVAAPVEEQDALFAPGEPLGDGLAERRADDGLGGLACPHGLGPHLAKVHHLDPRQRVRGRSLGKLQQLVSAGGRVVPGFE